MSTKIYNSYKIKNLTLDSFFELVKSLKNDVKLMQEKRYKESILSLCLNQRYSEKIHGNNKVYLKKTYYSDGALSRKNMMAHYLELKQQDSIKKQEMDEFYFHITVLFKNGNTYLLCKELGPSNYSSSIKKVFPKAISYDYWNNTDGPDDISQINWKKRGKEWDEVLGNNSNPSNCENSIKIEFPFDVGVRNFMASNFNDSELSLVLKEGKDKLPRYIRDKIIMDKEKEMGSLPIDYYRTAECRNLVDLGVQDFLKNQKKPSLDELLKEEVFLVKEKPLDEYPFYLIIFDN